MSLPDPSIASSSNDHIQPIDSAMQKKVIAEVQRYLLMAEAYYQQPFPAITVLFDLKGKTAGMYRVRFRTSRSSSWFGQHKPSLDNSVIERCLRFNPWLFAKYSEDSWDNTIPHEVAHYVVDQLYRVTAERKKIRPHGKQWQAVMAVLGAEPIVRVSYDLAGIPIKRIKRYPYRCLCRTVPLTTYRHNKVQKGHQRYRCRDCSSELKWVSDVALT